MNTKSKDGNEFVDAQEMAVNFPDSFEAPTKEELDALQVGQSVKICMSPERFWVDIKKIEGENIEGTVANDLVTNLGFDFGDTINFEKRHIYAIHE